MDFSKSTVSELAKGLDAQVKAWSDRPLEQAYPFILADALYVKVRRQGAVRSTAVLVAVGITETVQQPPTAPVTTVAGLSRLGRHANLHRLEVGECGVVVGRLVLAVCRLHFEDVPEGP